MQFRQDINGLRAIAVIAVVLFHFNPSWLPGGFAGVDVFFVISGFLMTGIIFKGMEQHNFSILNFYIARANRIVPALGFLCIALLVLGWFYLPPIDYKILAEHTGSSVGFISNIIYWKEAGYFDAASHEKWLLHTWSLSVEWQFYIIYPLVLVASKKFMTLKVMKATILLGTVMGFAFCVIVTYKFPDAAYYLLPTRAWEMMIGGVAYFYPFVLREERKKLVEWLGLILIVGSYFLISEENPWPGYFALFPVLGSYLVIQSQRNYSYVTSNPVLQKLGTWSYSIYLWHWPLVVTIYYFFLNTMFVYLGIVLSIFLGFLSYNYIEKIKFKNDFNNIFDYFSCKPIKIVLCVSVCSAYVYLAQGKNFIEYFYPENVDMVHRLEKKIVMPHRKNSYCFYSFWDDETLEVDLDLGTNCILGDKSKKPETLLFGDSFAGHYDPLLDLVFRNNNISYNSVSTNYCSPSFSDDFIGPETHVSYKQCLLNRQYLMSVIKNKKYKNLILSGAWNDVSHKGYLKNSEQVIYEAQKNGLNVFIMPAPLAYKQNPISIFYQQTYRGVNTKIAPYLLSDEQNTAANDMLLEFSRKYQNVFFINRSDLFNDNGLFDYDGFKVPYSLDGRHISLIGSLYSEQIFEKSLFYERFITTVTEK